MKEVLQSGECRAFCSAIPARVLQEPMGGWILRRYNPLLEGAGSNKGSWRPEPATGVLLRAGKRKVEAAGTGIVRQGPV